MSILIAFFAGALAAGDAQMVTADGPACAPHAKVVKEALWIRHPSDAEASHLFPPPTRTDQPIEVGRVVINCVFTRSGRLRACRVTHSENPRLNTAALKLMRFYQAQMDASCSHAGQHVEIPVNFKLGD
ncbi:MAG TPA: energy transducer TonB [Caulobacteraceae bacterium]|jgi:TonB family protein